jgi:hypothetical protein
LKPAEAVAKTQRWLESFVIGVGICPFARAPYDAGQLAITVCESRERDALYQELLGAIRAFVEADAEEQLTCLVLAPNGVADFEDYLDLLAALEQVLDAAGLVGVLQIASFHPSYRFADAPADDPANFTNRSPVPMFHLIREDHLASVLKTYPNPESIPQRNIAKLRSLGNDALQKTVDGLAVVRNGESRKSGPD